MIFRTLLVMTLLVSCKEKPKKQQTKPPGYGQGPESVGEYSELPKTSTQPVGGKLQWATTLGASENDVPYDVATTKNGDVLVSGYLGAGASLSDGEAAGDAVPKDDIDGFIVAYDKVGKKLWHLRLEGKGSSNITSIAVLGDTIIIGGWFDGELRLKGKTVAKAELRDGFVASIQPSGDLRWFHHVSGEGESRILDLALTPTGEVRAVGDFTEIVGLAGTNHESSGKTDIMILALDGAGKPLWGHAIGGVAEDSARGIVVDSKGHSAIIGSFEVAMRVLGRDWRSSGNVDYFVLKLDNIGRPVWSRVLGGQFDDFPGAIGVNAAGDIVVAGSFEDKATIGAEKLLSRGGLDIVVSTFDSLGTPKWSKRFGSSEDDRIWGLDIDAAGNIMLVGTTEGLIVDGDLKVSSAGHTDLLLASLTTDGALTSLRSFGDRDYDDARAVAFRDDGSWVVAGLFRQALTLSKSQVFNAVEKDKGLPNGDVVIFSEARAEPENDPDSPQK